MRKEFGMTYEFVLTVKTRWETQYKVVKTFKKAKDTFKLFARDRKNDCEN
jgi:hypothetical protein